MTTGVMLRASDAVGMTGASTPRTRLATISSADLGLGLRILADLMEAGLPIARALRAFEDLASPAWRAALPSIQQSVKEGRGFTAALASAPLDVPSLTIGILQAGESGTGLVPAVRRAAEVAESIAANRAAIQSALAYPCVVAIAGCGAIGVLMTVVLPRFASVLADLGQELPASTRFVLAAATFSRAAFLPALGGIAAAVFGMRAWLRTEAGRQRWHRLLLALPLVGDVRRAAATGRVASSLAALLDVGVPMSRALEHSARASGDAEIERRVREARQAIIRGEPLSTAMERVGAMTSVAVRLTRAGEQSGRLSGMLSHAARLEQDRADRAVKAAVRMLEPTLLLGFALLVGTVAASLLQAIYSVRPGG